ncbi:PAS domain [Pseudocohnilembus persalinus]|uniref:PAS domain n=1 Tax=Pseudocohnilembus persalinus TaxID=266149 RepID=A0A0V0QFS9_PSEPJ|nr:PAS domain [Pseudocohnilembus persalinus]|eukprot:KRX01054.1 PAS domain [Pseudocohnilembus persalinus]
MNLQAAILFWSTLMIIFALIVKNTVFRGIIYIWLVALPFIFLIVIIRKELRYDSLMVNSNNFESINQGVFQLTYFMQLLNYFYDDKHVAAILEALIYYHRTFCKQSGCASNPKNMNQKKIKKFFKNTKIEDISKVNQNYVVLVFLIDQLYAMTLTKYPNCITLRINHALFLLDIMKSSQQTLQELHLAEQLDPQFDEQFQIYRYKKIIEEDIFSKKNGKMNDQEISNEITIESHIKEIQYNIELSTNHHIEFWSQMAEDIPDLIKLYELGIKANQSSNVLEENWKKTEKLGLDLQAPNIMRIYIKYLLDVQHDKQSANDVISRLKLVYSTHNERAKKLTSMNDFQNESYSMVAVSGEDGSIGKVSALNIACSSEFGYTKSELLNRKVNTIMPQPFAQCHDKIIEDYLNSLQPKYLNRERKLFGQTKLGYLKPVLIYVRYVPSFIHGTQFFGSLKMEKYFKIVVYLLVDTKSLRVTSCTSTNQNLRNITGLFNKSDRISYQIGLDPGFKLSYQERKSKASAIQNQCITLVYGYEKYKIICNKIRVNTEQGQYILKEKYRFRIVELIKI